MRLLNANFCLEFLSYSLLTGFRFRLELIYLGKLSLCRFESIFLSKLSFPKFAKFFLSRNLHNRWYSKPKQLKSKINLWDVWKVQIKIGFLLNILLFPWICIIPNKNDISKDCLTFDLPTARNSACMQLYVVTFDLLQVLMITDDPVKILHVVAFNYKISDFQRL